MAGFRDINASARDDNKQDSMYRHLKTKVELSEIIRSVSHFFQQEGDHVREGQARRLLSDLAAERIPVAILRCVERTLALLTPERLEGHVNHIRDDLHDTRSSGFVRDKWSLGMAQIEKECLRLTEVLGKRIRSGLSFRFEREVDDHCADVERAVAAEIDLLLDGRKKFLAAEDVRRLADEAQGVAAGLRQQWFSSHRSDLEEQLRVLGAEELARLRQLPGKAVELAGELFRLSPPPTGLTADMDETGFCWKTVPQFEWDPPSAWELDILAVRWIRNRVRQNCIRTLKEAIQRYRGYLVEAMVEAGNEWADSMGAGNVNLLRSLHQRLAHAINGQTPSPITDRIEPWIKRLDELRVDLSDENPDTTGEASPVVTGKDLEVNRCFVCDRIAAGMFRFFTRYQYEVSVSESHREEHLARGGLCPLHTWQYESVASRDGVCTAYAPLLAALVRHLRDMASSIGSVDTIRNRLADLCPSPDSCPACRRLTEVEQEAIEEMKRSLSSGNSDHDGGGLCIKHLSMLIDGEVDPDVARKLIAETALVLQRVSESMQSYVLKRGALRRDLLNDEEVSAYLVGLTLLAGDRKLFPV
jgi:hypothetical protein